MKQDKNFIIELEAFLLRLNQLPLESELDFTPDGRARTLPISFVETTLDELFYGLWETENFKFQLIANEIVGSIDLIVTHPVTGQKYKRVGAGAIQIMVDRVPKHITDPTEKNKWALNPDNKKSNALDLGFPKLKAECIKNACLSLGKIFGRDVNRKKADTYKTSVTISDDEIAKILEQKRNLLPEAMTNRAEEILANGEKSSYPSLIAYLNKL